MVMDAQPSPQCVGLEFVRQYYTLLNQTPDHLHRFYNHSSWFVHGGLESVNKELDPVVGQKKIHERIQQLNFRDCHAKISQVDAQATLGNGVVVQVSGELSNAGEPMRRFTQTFVLVSQTPKKYYVHNDIFRYQDVYGDEEAEAESGRTDEDDQQVEQEHPVSGDMSPPQNQNIPGGYYGVNVGTGVAVNGSTHHDEVQVAPSGPQAPQGLPPQMMQPTLYQPAIDFHHLQQQQQPPPPPQVPPQQQAPPQLQATPQPPPQLQPQQQITGVSGVDQSNNQGQSGMIGSIPQDVYQPTEQEQEEEEEEEPEEVPIAVEEHTNEDEIESKQLIDSNYPSLDHDEVSHEIAPVANEPSTYATRLKSGTGGSSVNTTNLNVSPQGPVKSPSSPPPGSRLDNRNDLNLGGGRGQVTGRGGPRGGATVRGMSRGNDRSGQQRPAPLDDGSNFGENDKRRSGGGPQQHPDNQQLFLGNLPLNVTENDLRDLFGKFGSIVDLRIMNKSSVKGQLGNKLPNYGFIVFDNVTTVQTVLDHRPFYYPSPENGIKLNVEEKKTRARVPTDGRISSGGDVRGGGGGGGPRMGPGGPSLRVGNRGGFIQGRGIFSHGRGGAPMRPGGPGFNQRNSIPR